MFATGSIPSSEAYSSLTKIKDNITAKLISVTNETVLIVSNENKVYYMGSSQNYHFPKDESKQSLTNFSVWENPNDVEDIVDIASGHGFTAIVTANGKLWAWG